jgi:hypothetical protein
MVGKPPGLSTRESAGVESTSCLAYTVYWRKGEVIQGLSFFRSVKELKQGIETKN